MAGFHLAVVPVGRLETEELEAALSRAAKVLHRPLELREALALPPQSSEDAPRGQHRASVFINRLRDEVQKLRPGRLVGASDAAARAPALADAFLFVTDQDLYTASNDGAIGALLPAKRSAVLSIKRLREAFYRRKADPVRQRTRVVKELLRMWGRLAGAAECPDPTCLLAPTRSTLDLDTKGERFCRACEQRLFEGSARI
jgi:predicted Zn-dependent protease